MDIAVHVARGIDYRGRRVQQAPVVYVSLEGHAGLPARAAALRKHYGVGEVPLFFVVERLDLVRDVDQLIADIAPQKPGLVMIDTLNRSLTGSESKDEHMGQYIAACGKIIERLQCFLVIAHHSGVDASRPRGHTSLGGAVDAQIAVTRDQANNIIAEIQWLKDGSGEGDKIISRLKVIEVGTDEDGDPITSCVVVEGDALAAAARPERKLSDRQKLALDALSEATLTHGLEPPATFELPVSIKKICPVNSWRDEIYARGVIDGDGAANPRQDFRRLQNQLQVRALIGVRDLFVWRA